MATSSILRPLAVIAGVGNATGTGAATAYATLNPSFLRALTGYGFIIVAVFSQSTVTVLRLLHAGRAR